MARKWCMDDLIVIDVEATCWEDGRKLESEIIAIGVCLLNLKTLEVTDKRELVIKPTISTVSEFCTSLTGMTQEQVDTKGMSYQEACDVLWNDYKSSHRPWASYGDYDKRMFEKHAKYWDEFTEHMYHEEPYTYENFLANRGKYPFSYNHTNVKIMFTLLEGLTKACGLGKAVEIAGMEFTGTPHNGADDAENVARLMAYMLKKYRGE